MDMVVFVEYFYTSEFYYMYYMPAKHAKETC